MGVCPLSLGHLGNLRCTATCAKAEGPQGRLHQAEQDQQKLRGLISRRCPQPSADIKLCSQDMSCAEDALAMQGIPRPLR